MKQPFQQASGLSSGRVNLLFLDGLRGLLALYVVSFHAHYLVELHFQPAPLRGVAAAASYLLDYGHYAVGVFIVLSGYCLMLPVVRSGRFTIPGGIASYVRRRAWRILPPYYAALALSLGLIAFFPVLRQSDGEHWSVALPALAPAPILTHLGLVHSFFPRLTSTINPPMWSVGIEWWIYFLFPAVLLPLWRRFGMYTTLALVTASSVGLHWIKGHPADFFLPWYFALFGFGAAGAYVNFSPGAGRERGWNWTGIAWVSGIAAGTLLLLAHGWCLARPYAADILTGAAAAAFIVRYAARAQTARPAGWLLGILQSRLALLLGNISYSLYLVHDPILALLSPAIRAMGWSLEAQFYANVCFGSAASLLVAYSFHRCFERPFLRGHPKSLTRVATSVIVEPAL